MNGLNPTLESTLLKIVEESGELARAVLAFLPYENQGLKAGGAAGRRLAEVAGELLDVAQTCITMIFVLEDAYGLRVEELLQDHLEKLKAKGYLYDQGGSYYLDSRGGYKCLSLPRLFLEGVTLLKTVCKIQEETGELTQFLGKGAGKNGEVVALPVPDLLEGSALELLDIAQCCFTMLYLLVESYGVDLGLLLEGHWRKLRRKGYAV